MAAAVAEQALPVDERDQSGPWGPRAGMHGAGRVIGASRSPYASQRRAVSTLVLGTLGFLALMVLVVIVAALVS